MFSSFLFKAMLSLLLEHHNIATLSVFVPTDLFEDAVRLPLNIYMRNRNFKFFPLLGLHYYADCIWIVANCSCKASFTHVELGSICLMKGYLTVTGEHKRNPSCVSSS